MAEVLTSATRKPVSDAPCRGRRRRRAGGLTLLELGIVIVLVGFLTLLLVDQQTRILQDRASRARQDQVVANATAILEAMLNYNEDIFNWPTGAKQSVAALDMSAVPLMTYLPNADRISNPYAPRPGLDPEFWLEGRPNMLQTDPALELSFQVWGQSDARYIAGLLPFGKATQVGTSDVWDVSAQVVWAGLEQYMRADGRSPMDRLRFKTTPSSQDRSMSGGVQGIENVDRITFDTDARARTDANPNTIRGADRLIHQRVETGDLTGLELEADEASLLVRDGVIMSHRARFDVVGTQGRLQITREIAGGLTPLEEGTEIGFESITVPDGGEITIGTGGDITIGGTDGDVSVDGSDGLHERLCELEAQLETDSSGLTSPLSGTYTEDPACP